MFSSRRKSRGFSLLELVVALVVLAVLAAIAVPTFGRVVERSHDEAATTSLASYAREVQSLAAFRADVLTEDDFETAEADLTAFASAAGLQAAGVDLQGPFGNVYARAAEETGTSAVVSYAIAGNGKSAAMAGISAADHCVGVRFTTTQVSVVTMPQSDGHVLCTGANALNSKDLKPGDPPGTPPPALQPPTQVFGLSGKGAGGKAVLSWDEVANASSYQVLRGTDVVATSSTPSATVDHPYGETHSYTVVAVNKKGSGPASEPVPVVHAPAAPVISDVEMDGAEAVISWTPVPGATSYNLYRDGSDTVAGTAGEFDTSLRVPVAKGQTAVFVLRAGNLGGLSDGSAPAGVTAIPAPPTDVLAEMMGENDGSLALSWSPSEGATGYYVYYTDGRFAADAGNVTTLFGLILEPGESTSFVVVAENAGGASAASEPSNVVSRAPSSSSGLTARYADGNAVLVWDATPGAASYEIFEDFSAAPVRTGITGTTTSLPIERGTSVTYQVAARNAAGLSARSNAATATAPPLAPEGVTVQKLAGSEARVSWTAAPGATQYEVFRIGPDGPYAVGFVRSPDTSFDAPLAKGETGVFFVLAGNQGGWSERSATASLTAVPAAPTNVTASLSGSTVTVSWTGSSGATGYDVFYSDGTVAKLNAASPTTVPLGEGASATFVVKAKNAGGASEGSAPSNTVTRAPAAPTNVTAVMSSSTAATVSWTAPSGATSYEVSRDGVWKSVTGTSTTYTLAAGETESFTVRALNAGGTGPVSSSVSVTAVPAAPSGVAVKMVGDDAEISWNQTSGATSYHVFRDASSTAAAIEPGSATKALVPLTPGQSATFYVKAGNSGGLSAASATVGTTRVPAAPTNVTATLSGGTVTVSWTGSSGATAYDVYYSDNTVAKLAVTGTSTTLPLAEGASASYVVKATNAGGASAGSAPSNTVTRAPAAPSGVSATMSAPTTATVSWAAVPGASSYEVFNEGAWKAVPGTSTTYTVPAGRTTYFVVRALNAGGTSSNSAAAYVTAIPAAPSGVSVKMVGDDAEVSWNQTSGATSYEVFRSGSNQSAGIVQEPTRKLLVSMTPGQTASFYVKAGNSAGWSAASQAASTTRIADAPTNVTATLSGGTVTVSWTGSSGATAYDVYYSDNTVAKLAVTGTSTTLPLAEGASASYVVKATNAGGASAGSAPSNTVTRAPAVPQNVKVTMSGASGTLSWDAVPGATLYEIFENGSATATTTVGSPSYPFTKTFGSTTSFRVRAVNAGGPSGLSASVTATVAPDAPANVSATVAGAKVTVAWSATSGANGYYVYRNGSSTISATLVGNASTSVQFDHAAGETASFSVRAYNDAGPGPASSTVSATSAPAVPTGVSLQMSGTSATVSWSPVSGATSYQVRDGATDQLLRDVQGQASSTTTFTVPAGETVSYSVRALNAAGASAGSAVVSGTASPAAPTNVSAVAPSGSNVVTVSWTASEGASEYVVERGNATTITVTGTSTTFTLSDGSTESFRVLARNTAGSSPWSTSVSETVRPAIPQNFKVAVSGTTATLTWNTVSGANGYYVYQDGSATVTKTVTGGASSSTTIVLANNQTADFVLRAYNDGGTSAATPAATGSTPPAVPATPTISAVTTTSMTVSWTAVSGATEYVIYHTPAGGSTTEISVTGTSRNFTGLTPGTQHSFQVAAKNANATSAKSGTSSDVTDLSAPTGVTATASSSALSIDVDWAAVSGATSYTVYWRPSGGTYASVNVNAPTTNRNFTGLSEFTTYQFYVVAKTSAATSPNSATVSAQTTGTPGSISDLRVLHRSTTDVRVVWKPAANATTYRVERQRINQPWELVWTGSGGTPATGWKGGDSSAFDQLTGGTYYYRITPENNYTSGPRTADRLSYNANGAKTDPSTQTPLGNFNSVSKTGTGSFVVRAWMTNPADALGLREYYVTAGTPGGTAFNLGTRALTLDGVGEATSSESVVRNDIMTDNLGYGENIGFHGNFSVSSPRVLEVCLYVRSGTGTSDLGCRQVDVR